LANANALVPHLPGATALLLAEGPRAYISANWYPDPRGAVPTWNYVAVEAEGVVSPIDRDALIALLDDLSAELEPRVGENWTRDKMAPA
ncbi:FMN-binding negative transcriptional regulator, partial [Salmonella enterica]|uniref:FMN-binding negative transcriptional regulator n=1 Tax=Salmonella enterica TaxID=28901 RepID=UPI003D2DA2FD